MTGEHDVPTCPRCGARRWRAVTAAEIRVEVDVSGITRVELAEPTPMNGELDYACVSCGEPLLDWRARTDDETWKAHHDERRPAWDLLNVLVEDLPLPSPATWRTT